MTVDTLPSVNALLNATSAALLVSGWLSIRTQHIAAHRLFMGAACVVSTLFLASYVRYHIHVGSVHFTGTGWRRPVYFAILMSHTILAVAIVPLVARTLFLALRGRFTQHQTIARWTLPLWLYVSVTGVVVYRMLYH